MYLFNRMSSDFSALGELFGADFAGRPIFFGSAESVVGLPFFGPCARFGIAGFDPLRSLPARVGLFELGLLDPEPVRLLAPSFLFINAEFDFVRRSFVTTSAQRYAIQPLF